MGYRRRRVLRGVGLAGVVGATLTAGCLDGFLSGVTGRDYTAWVPSPDELATVERFDFLRVNPGAVHDSNVVATPVETRFATTIERALALLGIPFDDLAGLARIGHFAVVLEGSFRVDRLADRLAGAEFRAVGSHGGYELYVDGETLVAVSTEAIVLGPSAGDASSGVIAPVVDANAGEAQRYTAAADSFAELTEALGDGDIVVARTGSVDTSVAPIEATGIAWRFDEGVAKAALAFVFPEGTTVDTGALEELTHGDGWATFDDVDVGRRGRVGIVTATAPVVSRETLAPFTAIERAVATEPTATFEATYGSELRTATIIHAGGDAIPRRRLSLQGEGFRADPSVDQGSPGDWAGGSDSSTAIEPGDSVTVGIHPDATLRLRYRPIGDSAVRTLQTFQPD